MGLIVGEDNFGAVIEKKLGFIDKSLFIKELLDNEVVTVPVIIRPRRFGKTLNMSMLHHFLAAEVNGLKTEGMFDHLKIAKQGDRYMQQQGKYPVIFISLKSLKLDSYEKVYKALVRLISKTYAQHSKLLESNILQMYEKKIFEDILNENASRESLMGSLADLSEYLHRHYKVKPWILIDEYDSPIQAGYLNNYYKDIIELMRGLLGAALKGNVNIHRAVVTGILRIAKEDLFSGLNNLKVFSVLDARYSDCFGFTQEEVDLALKQSDLQYLSKDIKAWYNGYHIGDSQIYNPWSIASCIDEKVSLKPYWINTSDNELIKKLLAESNATFKERFEAVLQNRSIEVFINENLTFSDLSQNEEAVWSLLLFSGYLTAKQVQQRDIELQCSLFSPNQEISALYRSTIRGWFTQKTGEALYQKTLQYLVNGQLDLFLPLLQKFLRESSSYFDVKGDEPEKFYHGFVMGLIVSLSDSHIIHSNKESGLGRYDVLLIPKDKTRSGIILEFKVAKPDADLQESAEEALEQIKQRGYAAELEQQSIFNILKVGLAFRGKEVALASK